MDSAIRREVQYKKTQLYRAHRDSKCFAKDQLIQDPRATYLRTFQLNHAMKWYKNQIIITRALGACAIVVGSCFSLKRAVGNVVKTAAILSI